MLSDHFFLLLSPSWLAMTSKAECATAYPTIGLQMSAGDGGSSDFYRSSLENFQVYKDVLVILDAAS